MSQITAAWKTARVFISSTQANGQACCLKLHHGQRRIPLAEAEAILVERGDLPVISDHRVKPVAPSHH